MPKVTVQPTEQLDADDPPQAFMTPHGHLGADVVHNLDPDFVNAEAPLYQQTAKHLGWDPRAGDTGPREKRYNKKTKSSD